MRLSTLFVMDPLDRIDVSVDSTYMLMLEAERRGWPVWMCTPADLHAEGGRAFARARQVETRRDSPYFRPGPVQERPLDRFDVVWMRKDPPFDMDYVFTTYLLELAGPSTLVLNRPAALRDANEKMVILRWPHLIAPTLVTNDKAQARAWIEQRGERAVIKPWDANAGRGVVVTGPGDENLAVMLELLTDDGRRHVLVQRYIPEIRQGDKRIILVDGEPGGWMLRVPRPGDHRGNMHVGAVVAPCDLTSRDRQICATLGPWLKEQGLLFVGIDVIGGYLTEVNVTSPTGIQEVNRLMDVRLERMVSDAVEARWRALQESAGA